MSEPLIDESRVYEIFNEAYDPSQTSTLVQDGIADVYMDMQKLLPHREEVAKMLGNLPLPFLAQSEGGGGGWSFLNACHDRNGVQWTGLHMVVNQLFTMGCALGLAKLCLPRVMWEELPGGMPYYVVSLSQDKETAE